MAVTHFSGPLAVGELIQGQTNGPNQGYVECFQGVGLTQNSTTAVTQIIYVPAGSIIREIIVDVLTAFDSATSAILTAGSTAAASTQYITSVNCKAATGRIAYTYTAAQLAAMSGQSIVGAASASGVPGPIYITITPTGATTAGYVYVGVRYVPSQVNN
jgi:hypothetical protein